METIEFMFVCFNLLKGLGYSCEKKGYHWVQNTKGNTFDISKQNTAERRKNV